MPAVVNDQVRVLVVAQERGDPRHPVADRPVEQQLAVRRDLVGDQQVEVLEPCREQQLRQRRVQLDAGLARPPVGQVGVGPVARDVELGLAGAGHDVVLVGLAEVDAWLDDLGGAAVRGGRQVLDPQLRLAFLGHLVDGDHREADAVRVDHAEVDPAVGLRVAVDRELAARQHHLAQVTVDDVAVRVHVDEVVVLADDLELVHRRLQRTVVPQARVGERVRLVAECRLGERGGPVVGAWLPLVEPVGELRHPDVVRDVLLFLHVLVRVHGQALDRLRVEAAKDQRGREPDDHDGAERPHPAREGACDEQRAGKSGQEGQDVVRHEPGVGVRVAHTDRGARRAVDELVLVELVAEGDRQEVQARDDGHVDADPGDEHLAALRRLDEIPGADDQERREQQPVEERLGEPEERQVEQEEADVAPEDRIGHQAHPARTGRG